MTEAYDLRDDFSCPFYSSSASCASKSAEFSSYSRINKIISNISEELDRSINEILCFNSKEQGLHPNPFATSKHKDPRLRSSTKATRKPIFDHVLVEPLPQLDMKPCFIKEKRKPESNHLPLKKRFVWRGDCLTHSPNCATPSPN